MSHSGNCLCGGVRYVLRGELGPITPCHCSQCRKAQGGAVQGGAAAADSPVCTAEFEITQGRDLLRAWESSPGKERVFCGRCGAPLYSRRVAETDFPRLRIGSLDAPVGPRPMSSSAARPTGT